jgi:pimeloyl-ACP methyl ester carboxylesterase
LIAALETKGYVKLKTIRAFGYDWRQTNTYHVFSLKKKIEDAMKVAGTSMVDILCHSMGGLVTRCFLAKEPEFFATHVRKWIACGTPWLGSPALTAESLLTGVELAPEVIQKPFAPDRQHLKNALVHFPSAAELTPRAYYKWRDGNSDINIWMHDDALGKVVKYVFPSRDLEDIQKKVFKGNRWRPHLFPYTVQWESDPNVWKQARETKAVFDSAELPTSVQFYCIHGVNSMCAFGVTYGTIDEPVISYEELAKAKVTFSFVNGDQTVPTESAVGHGFEVLRTEIVYSTHSKMLNDPMLHDHVMSFLGV